MCQHALTVHDRRDREGVPEGGAVLAVVQQLRPDGLAPAQGLAQQPDRLAVGARALQEPTVESDDLAGLVAGHLLEGRVDPDQRVVVTARVGDRERDLGRHQRPRRELVEVAGVADLGQDARVRLAARLVGHEVAGRRVGPDDGRAVGTGEGLRAPGSGRACRQLRGEPGAQRAVPGMDGEQRDDRPLAGHVRGREQLAALDPVGPGPPRVVEDVEPHARHRAARSHDGDRVDDGQGGCAVLPPTGHDETGGGGPLRGGHGELRTAAGQREGLGVRVGDQAAARVEKEHRHLGVVRRAHSRGGTSGDGAPAHEGQAALALVVQVLHPLPPHLLATGAFAVHPPPRARRPSIIVAHAAACEGEHPRSHDILSGSTGRSTKPMPHRVTHVSGGTIEDDRTYLREHLQCPDISGKAFVGARSTSYCGVLHNPG